MTDESAKDAAGDGPTAGAGLRSPHSTNLDRRFLPKTNDEAVVRTLSQQPQSDMPARTVLLCLCLSLAGCSEQEVHQIEKVSTHAWTRATEMGAQAAQEIGLDVEDAGACWKDWEIFSRVQSRLRFDQLLHGAAIKVEIENGQVTLSGSVQDEQQRRRAVELVESTEGVAKVREALRVSGK